VPRSPTSGGSSRRDTTQRMTECRTVVVATHWHDRSSELAFVTRALAGAASRWGQVSILSQGPPGHRVPDGAFDVLGIGPDDELGWPTGLSPDCTVVVDELTPAVTALLHTVAPRVVRYLSGAAGTGHEPGWQKLLAVNPVGTAGPAAAAGTAASAARATVSTMPAVAVYVPVNPLAERQRHHGFGFVGYQLVLSDRPTRLEEPPPEVAWITAALPDVEVVLVEEAVASVWKGRSLRGRVSVDTRMDLWRLLAHAQTCVDLAPGPLLARECVEALRFGTPIIVPSASGAAAAHVARGGGATFSDPDELLAAATRLRDQDEHSAASSTGRAYADATHGDPEAFLAAVSSMLASG